MAVPGSAIFSRSIDPHPDVSVILKLARFCALLQLQKGFIPKKTMLVPNITESYCSFYWMCMDSHGNILDRNKCSVARVPNFHLFSAFRKI